MKEPHAEKRRYIRHPSNIPIEVNPDHDRGRVPKALRNVSFGGICFHSAVPFESGEIITIRIALIRPVFTAKGRVVWCRPVGDAFDVGIEFVDTEDAFRARMVEQVCHIEQYRKEIRERDGRELDGRAAALEWITKFARDF
jgi:hypothetical protein